MNWLLELRRGLILSWTNVMSKRSHMTVSEWLGHLVMSVTSQFRFKGMLVGLSYSVVVVYCNLFPTERLRELTHPSKTTGINPSIQLSNNEDGITDTLPTSGAVQQFCCWGRQKEGGFDSISTHHWGISMPFEAKTNDNPPSVYDALYSGDLLYIWRL